MKYLFLTTVLISTVGSLLSQSCDTLRNYNLSDPLYEFSGDFGHALGHDFINGGTEPVTKWAEPYSVGSQTEVRAIQFIPWKIHDAGGAIQFHIYNDNAGEPGTSIFNQTVPLNSIDENFLEAVEINPGVTVNGDFWVGYELQYNTPQDTFAILGTFKPGGNNFTKMFFDGDWENVDNIYEINGSDPLISAWAVDVLTSNAPDPEADFTTNWSACLSGEFLPDASASENADEYDWILGDTPFTTTYETATGLQPTIEPTQSGGDQAIYLLAFGGCRVDIIGYGVDVYDDIDATFSTTSTTCGLNNGQIEVTNPSGGSGNYSYSLDGQSYQGSNIFSNLSNGNHTVYVASSGDGCEETFTVNISDIPQETISVGANQVTCSGEPVSISASGNGTIEWFEGTTSIGTGTSISVSPTTTTSYEAVLTDNNNCEDTDMVEVSVNSLPNVSAGSDAAICIGESTTISASGASTYTWDQSLGNGQSKNVSPTATTTYEVTGTDGNGCQNTDEVEITVNPLPNVDAGNDNAICDGISITISASGASSYTWDNGLGAGQSHSVSPSTTTTYEVTGTDGNNCVNTDEVIITVDPLDDASFTFNNFCDEATSNGPTNITTSNGTFSFNPAPGDGATIDGVSGEISNFTTGTTYSVEYETSGTCPSSSVETVTVQSTDDASFEYADICIGNNLPIEPYNIATQNGTFDFDVAPIDGATIDNNSGEISNYTAGSSYDVIYTTPAGDCQNSEVLTVDVFNAPNVIASNDETICENDPVTIIASGADTYSWDNSVGAGDSHQVSPNTTTTYTVTGEDNSTGCINFDEVTITVNPLPNVSASATQTEICDGDTILLEASGADSYNWDNNLGAGATHEVIPSSNTTYEVTGEDQNGCENISSISIVVNNSPNLTVTQDDDICEGNNIQISASGADGYTWDNGLSAVNSHQVSPNETTTYNVIGENANGCIENGSVTITVYEVPVADAGNDLEICEGEEVTLNAQTTIGSISWDQGVSDGVPFTPNETETYTVTAENNGCIDTDELEVIVNELPTVDAGDDRTFCIYDGISTLSGIPDGGSFLGPGVSNNEFDPEDAGTGSHTITYSYEDQNGCENSATLSITVDACASVEEYSNSTELVLKPNPATNFVDLVINDDFLINEIEVISSFGQSIPANVSQNGNSYRIDVSSFAKGTYLVRVSSDKTQNILRFVVN